MISGELSRATTRRDRQIQGQAYNWGVEDVLEAHYRDATVPNPRNNSKPLTALRRETGSGHSLCCASDFARQVLSFFKQRRAGLAVLGQEAAAYEFRA